MLIIGAGQSRKKGKFETFMLGSARRRKMGGSWLNRMLDRREFKKKGVMGF